MACIKAEGISIINPHTFSATPIPAEATSPSPFTMASSTRKEIPTRKSCRAMGTPREVTFRIMPPSKRRSERSRWKGRPLLRRISRETATLIICAATVAAAAPAVPILNTATSSRSPAILHMQAISTVISGVFESPIPRKMLPIRL